jgi:hypothetical protein
MGYPRTVAYGRYLFGRNDAHARRFGASGHRRPEAHTAREGPEVNANITRIVRYWFTLCIERTLRQEVDAQEDEKERRRWATTARPQISTLHFENASGC